MREKLGRLIAVAAVLLVATALPVAADQDPLDGHGHGDLEELTAEHLHGSDFRGDLDAQAAATTYFNESSGCGEPSGTLAPLTTTNSSSNRSIPSGHQVRGPWGDFYGRNYSEVSKGMVNWTVPMSGGRVAKVHEHALPAFQQVTRNLQAEAAKGRHYNVRITGSWVWRRIGGLYRMSTHSFGHTIDINWDRNPFRSDNTLVTDMPEWFIDAWRDAGFCWGGDWNTIKDPMHFSWKGPLSTPDYGAIPRPKLPHTVRSNYTNRVTNQVSALGAIDSNNLYTFFDGNADGAADLFRVEPWGDDDLLVQFARSSRSFEHCGVSRAVVTGGRARSSKIVVADLEGTSRPDIWSIDDADGKLEVKVFTYASRYADTRVRRLNAAADPGASYLAGDHNRDGVPDLYVIHRDGDTVVDVYDGASKFETRLFSTDIDLAGTASESRWRFDLLDDDFDGVPDLGVIDVNSSVKVHFFSGKDKLRSKIRSYTTGAVAQSGATYEFEDWDGDGRDDLMMYSEGGKVQAYLAGVQNSSSTFWFQQSGWQCGSVGSSVSWDFNGDRIAELPIGVPGEDVGGIKDAGVVDVLRGTAAGPTKTGAQRWHQDVGTIAGPVETGDRFGESMTWGDFDGDGYGDIAVGAPTDGIGSIAAGGLVNVIYGGKEGLDDDGNQMWHRDTTGVDGTAKPQARFGSVLAAGDFDNDGWDDLAIGVPGDRVSGVWSAGSVTILYGEKGGLSHKRNQLWHQDSAKVKGAVGSGDRFGAALAIGDFDDDGYDDLAIGAPGDALAGHDNAGVVNVLYGSERGLRGGGNQRFSLALRGVKGAPKTGELFGAALAAGDFDADGRDDLAIGVPGENWGSKRNAGRVQVVYGSPQGLNRAGDEVWHAEVAGVPGTGDRHDLFGAALAVGDFDRNGFDDLVIGAPGESIPSATETGAVTVLYGTTGGISTTGADLWLQGHDGLPGTPEDGDHFGETLRAADLDGDDHHDLVIGMPGEDLDVKNAGALLVLYGESSGLVKSGARIWYEEAVGTGTASAGDGLGRL